MAEKFNNKYRIPSSRQSAWDYSRNAAYFITICCKDRQRYFGIITNGNMQLSAIGSIAAKFWYDIPQHFHYVKLDAFIVMPDHIHGIIIIDKSVETSKSVISVETPKLGVSVDTSNMRTSVKTPKLGVSVDTSNMRTSVETPKLGVSTSISTNAKKWKSGTLGVIINQYKRICTIHARKIEPDFSWQPRFYDTIIHDEKTFVRISEYIRNNPLKWRDDTFFE